MPLSEHEENVLKEIERQLAAEDPRFAARTRGRRVRRLDATLRRRLTVLSAVLGVIGLVSIGFIEGPVQYVGASIGLVLIFVAILLGLSGARNDEQHRAFVPPDERT